MLAAFLAVAMTQLAPPVVIPKTQLHVTWNQSPNGPGGSLMGYQPDQEPSTRFDLWQGIHPQRDHDYFLLGSNAGQPWLILNTPNGCIETGRVQSPGAVVLPGFVLTSATQTPFMLEFTCNDARTATGWRNNGNPLVITITP